MLDIWTNCVFGAFVLIVIAHKALRLNILDVPVIFLSVYNLLSSTEAVAYNETYYNYTRYLKGRVNQKTLPPLGWG